MSSIDLPIIHVIYVIKIDLPVYTRHIDHDVDHLAAKLVRLHVDRRTVGCDVDLTNNVEEKSFFDGRILKLTKKGSTSSQTIDDCYWRQKSSSLNVVQYNTTIIHLQIYIA